MHKHDKRMLMTAVVWSTASYAKRKQVGCVIAKDARPIAVGYNGTLPGMPNECEGDNGETLPEVMHAEQNALMFAAKNGLSTDGCTAYLTLSPCVSCAKMLVAAGITRVVFSRYHSCQAGLDLLERCGVHTDYISEEEMIHEH